MNYASFWSRLAACFLDSIIIRIIGVIIIFIINLVLGGVIGDAKHAVSLVVVLVAIWLHYAFQESSPKQATLGKQALGIVVTDMDGQQISFARATGRYFGKFLSGFVLFIGYIMPAFTEKKQALHDMLAGTLVVKK